jgi:F-box/WD-40 domain protein MET30
MLKGIVSTCCMPQLSFLHNVTKPLLRIDFVAILPREVLLTIFGHLDAKSLCHAAQVSSSWKDLADDDSLWHHMCEQHIDKRCSKCGWGLPLLDKNRTRKRLSTSSPTCGPSSQITTEHQVKRIKSFHVEKFDTNDYPTPAPLLRRPWKEVYSERLVVERNWRTKKCSVRTLLHSHGVMCLQFCDILNIVITGTNDNLVIVWDLTTGQMLRKLKGHTRCIRALQFDEAKLVTGSMDHTLKIWNYQTGECIRTLEGHNGGILGLHYDSRIMASGSTDATIRVWNFEAGECFSLLGHTEWVNSVRICQGGARLISSSDDATVRLWDLENKQCLQVYRGHVGQVQVAIPSPHGFTHFLNPNTATIQPPTGEKSVLINGSDMNESPARLTTPGCATAPTRQIEPSASRPLINNATSPNNVDFVDGHTTDVSSSPIVVSSSLDNTVKLWDMQTGKCMRTLFGHVQGVWSLSLDNLRIVSGSHDKTIRIWDIQTGKSLNVLVGHTSPVTAIALSDTKIVSASDDGEIKIWDFK